MDKQKLPNLVIAGTNRGGTTSLFTYLSRHPEICASAIKETNFFMPAHYHREIPPLGEYMEFFKHCNGNSKYWMESSPRYLVGGAAVAESIRERLGDIKILFLVRDPLPRLLSYYKQRQGVEVPLTATFEQYVDLAIEGYTAIVAEGRQGDIDVYEEDVYVRGLVEGFYHTYLAQWYDVFGDSIKVCFFEDLKHSTKAFMLDLSNWLDIDPDPYNTMEFTVENRTVHHRNRSVYLVSDYVNKKFEPQLRRYHGIKKLLRNIYYAVNEKKAVKTDFTEETADRLREIYRPHNLKLKAFLQEKGHDRFPDWVQ